MLINIQFLRFAAALAVVIYHASKHVAMSGADQGFFFSAGEAAGFAGVDVFFVISGFIMFYTTEGSSGGASSVDFLKRRVARIYSGYWPFFIFAALVFAWARPDHFAEAGLLSSAALWPMPLNHVLLDVSWTLTYEMYFYLLFTALVLTGARLRWQLIIFALAGMFAYNLYRHFVLHDFSPENIYNHSFSSQFLTSPFLLEFFAGAVIAAVAGRKSFGSGWALLLGGMALFAGAGLANALGYDGKIEQGYYVVPRVLLFGIPSGLILLGLVQLERDGAVAPRKFSLYAGGASYAIYLSHTIFLVATMKLGFNVALEGLPDFVVQLIFGFYCALIVAFSIGWYRLVERPLLAVFKRALRIKRPPAND
ncbi:MAG: acyltransferase [Xanthomonadales bacterium]|nr:acyltransferase [Gammaproteobacteria bacterium]NND56419.1 acyltransferase [Xanthomonadales bacterium]